ncbi:MAG TPA: metalloregulator ArsR/SmtB family transcription factor [Herpetosiphonaceae bacterium]
MESVLHQPHCGTIDEEDTASLRAALIDQDRAAEMAQLFKALSDPTRIRLISILAVSEVCVHTLADLVDMTQSAVSHQLRSLRELRLVKARKDGRHVFYRLDDQHVAHLFQAGLEHTTHH